MKRKNINFKELMKAKMGAMLQEHKAAHPEQVLAGKRPRQDTSFPRQLLGVEKRVLNEAGVVPDDPRYEHEYPDQAAVDLVLATAKDAANNLRARMKLTDSEDIATGDQKWALTMAGKNFSEHKLTKSFAWSMLHAAYKIRLITLKRLVFEFGAEYDQVKDLNYQGGEEFLAKVLKEVEALKVVLKVQGQQAANRAEAEEIRRLRQAGVRLYNRLTGCPAATGIFWALHKKNARQ
ncbi:hypothetical protein PLESTF_001008500 [Pleodorina starrii]|nr:hypothetical protein PLESTF_001008500 [Pleodorina starrii]